MKKVPVGDFINIDTNFTVNIGAQVYNDTLTYASREYSRNKNLTEFSCRVSMLYKLDDIVKNSILLNTEVINKGENKYRTFMHSFYNFAEINGQYFIVKLKVDELETYSGSIRRAYNLNKIEISPVAVSQVYKPADTTDDNSNYIVTINTVADLFALVKKYDSEFNPKPVNKDFLNEDGTPKVFYHGTNAKWTQYDLSKNVNQMWGEGIYLTPYKERARLYGDNVMAFYVKADTNYRTAKINGKTRDYTFMKKTGDILVYSPNQIKSVTKNIGTFDGNNPDIRYQYAGRKSKFTKKDFNQYDDLTKLDTKQIKVYNDYGWTYQLFTAEDFLLLNEKFNEKYNLYKNQNDFVLGDGLRVVEVNNKIVLIGGSFKNPIIYDVFVVNSNNETEAEIYKELLLNDTEDNWSSKQRYIDICKSYEHYSEEETVRNYESTDFSYHKGQKDSGERAVLPESFKNYGYTKQFQNRGRDNSDAEQGISNNQVDKVFQMRTDGTYIDRLNVIQ